MGCSRTAQSQISGMISISTIVWNCVSTDPSAQRNLNDSGTSLKRQHTRFGNLHMRWPWCTTWIVCIALALLQLGAVDSQQEQAALKFKPVWQWVNPALETSGIQWPEGRKEGEVKECTCAFLSYSDNTCIDSVSQGRAQRFECGLGNSRRRTGHDELLAGMRPFGPCFCESTKGESLARFLPESTLAVFPSSQPPAACCQERR